MEIQGERHATGNALKREVGVRVELSTRAPAEVVYDVLADIGTHLRWAGEMQRKRNHLLTIDPPSAPAAVGAEFTTTGIAPEGTYTDRSVVTEATRPSVFEFVTQAHLATKKGKRAELTNVSRYEITPTPGGCRVSSTVKTVRASALPGPLALLNVGLLAPFVRRDTEALVRRGLRNLTAVAEERAGLRAVGGR